MKKSDLIYSKDKSKNPDLRGTPILGWSFFIADLFEDSFAALLGFIPNGIGSIYDNYLKNMPIVGKLFEIQSVETVLKIILGVTIGQGIAMDAAKYIFRPIGFLIGAALGSTILASLKLPSPYKGKIGDVCYHLSGQTVLGALIGLIAVVMAGVIKPELGTLNTKVLLLSLVAGACVGLMTKAMLLLAINIVNQANAANLRRSIRQAKNLSEKLKEIAKQKIKSKIYQEAQDLIQKMNGPQSQENLEAFLQDQYESIVYHTNQKINRHFNYLSDRACCGDIQALKKLKMLIQKKQRNKFIDKSPLEVMIDRIFNQRTIFQLRDDIDNSYDRWRYQFGKTLDTL